jgi:hypothetical protein
VEVSRRLVNRLFDKLVDAERRAAAAEADRDRLIGVVSAHHAVDHDRLPASCEVCGGVLYRRHVR